MGATEARVPLAAKASAQAERTDLVSQVEQVIDSSEGARGCLVVLDQFEEVFQHWRDSKALDEFAREVARLVHTPGLEARVLISMREEFLGELSLFDNLIPDLFNNCYRLKNATLGEAEEIITRTAMLCGVECGPGLDALLADLNEPQREAVLHNDGPLLVLAGAGSGKTRALIRKIAWLVEVERLAPWEILAVTFTNKAAAEMRERATHLLGERADATRLMQAADFLVLPSHFEGLSNALLEAMAAGCPVIASAVGGSVELVNDGRTGLLFPANDADALAAAMSRIADPALRSRLAQAAKSHVKHSHSREALGTATAAVYERCLRMSDSGTTTMPAHPAGNQAK